MKIYLAGPMRGIAEFNFPAFHEAAERLRSHGHEVFSPAEKDNERHGTDISKGNLTGSEENASAQHGFNLREALGMDMAYITAHAEAIALLPGWEFSKGANAEKATADALGLKIMLLGGKPPERNVLLDSAHAIKIGETTEEVRQELVRARAKYGKFRGFHEAWGVIEEEWIELQGAIISNDPKAIRKEAIQVAAMAASLVADLC